MQNMAKGALAAQGASLREHAEVEVAFEASGSVGLSERPDEGLGGAPSNGPSVVIPQLQAGERDPVPPLPKGVLEPKPLPEVPKNQPMPLLRMLMPAVMVLAMVAVVALMVTSGGEIHPMMLMFPLFMVMSMLMMLTPTQGEDINEARRAYLRHLVALRDTALEHARAQRVFEERCHPAPNSLWNLVGSRAMWERSADDPDALAVRVGLGPAALCTPIEVHDPGPSEQIDPVCAIALRQLVQAVGVVQQVPIALQLQAFRVVALSGTGAESLARAMVVQLAYHHGPEAVGIEIYGQQWRWAKWLPHCRQPDQAVFRVLVVPAGEQPPAQMLREDYATIVCLQPDPGGYLQRCAEEEGIALHVDVGLETFTEAGAEQLGTPDALSYPQAEQFARSMAPYVRPPKTIGTSADLRRLLGIDDGSREAIEAKWQPRGRDRLSVPIGLTTEGQPLVLDIKEAAQGGMGPHGLCVGATGSGKSELLRTLVVALVATHSPDDLNLVLVDFKGGATFLGLDRLAHTSAVITNLEEEAVLVERMHDAISGEMHRRQQLLRQAGNFANVTEYNAARRTRPEMPPLPSLLVVVDEFSELLGQHPDFADLFVAVGRLGRSLNMHLLLASQRLEEGRLRGLDSHLSYRIGLKTFSAAESRQVLGVPDAYALPNQPGAGFLKTSNGELVQFRASYVSGALKTSHRRAMHSRGVHLWHGWAHTPDGGGQQGASEGSHASSMAEESTSRTLVDAVVEGSNEAAHARGEQATTIWLPPLPAEIPLAGVVERSERLRVPVGIIDRPFHQRQDPLVMDFTGQGGHAAIVGGPRSGKTTALRSMVLSLAATHHTDEVRVYVLDLAGTDLASLAKLPHVAGVAHRDDPERVRRVIDEVYGLLQEPQQRHTFLVVDGWHVLAQDFEDVADRVAAVAIDGLAARVHLVVATSRWAAIRPAVRDLITQRFELKLGEALDSLIDRKLQQHLPARPGRGLAAKEHILFALSSQQDVAHVVQVCAELPRVPALKVLPTRLPVAEIPAGKGIGLGVGGPRLGRIAWDSEHLNHAVCFGSQGSGKSALVRRVLTEVAAYDPSRARIVLIDHRRSHLGVVPEPMLAGYSATASATQELIESAAVTLRSRLPQPDVTPQQLRERSWWQGPDIFVVIDDLDLVQDYVLQPLVALLPHARDIGLRVVVSRKIGGASRACFQPFLAELKDQSPLAVILDGERDEGPLFGVRPSHQPPGRATVVERGTVVGVCQLAFDDPPTWDDPPIPRDTALSPSAESPEALPAEELTESDALTEREPATPNAATGDVPRNHAEEE